MNTKPYEGARILLGPFAWLGRFWSESVLRSGGFLVAVVIAWIVEFVFCVSASSSFSTGVANFCVLWFVSGAASFVGTISGILFGLPRFQLASTRDSANFADREAFSRYRVNTNFEDVSDWLTKIIVGIGIAQFPKVVEFFGLLGSAAGSALKVENGANVISTAAIIYGIVCGFLYYYIWARLRLQRLLETPD